MSGRRAAGLAARRAAWRRGRLAETICVWSLRLRGWRIVARGWRVPVGEIDIIARRGGTLAAIEVKARDTYDAAAEAVSPRQQRRVARAFSVFLPRLPVHHDPRSMMIIGIFQYSNITPLKILTLSQMLT